MAPLPVRAVPRLFLWVLPAVFAACTAPSGGVGSRPASPPSLADTEWVGLDLGGRPPVDGSRVTLRFDPAAGRVAGHAGCNRFSAAYRLEEQRGVRIVPPMVTTKQACAAPLMQQETRVLTLLAAVAGHAIEPSGTLVLRTVDGTALRFEAAAPAR